MRTMTWPLRVMREWLSSIRIRGTYTRSRARIYSQQSQHKEAIAEFLEAIKQVPNNSDLYEELGSEYRKSSELDLAQQAYSKELALSPNNPVAMYNLAKIDIETNRAEEGLDCWKRWWRTTKTFPQPIFISAWANSMLASRRKLSSRLRRRAICILNQSLRRA